MDEFVLSAPESRERKLRLEKNVDSPAKINPARPRVRGAVKKRSCTAAHRPYGTVRSVQRGRVRLAGQAVSLRAGRGAPREAPSHAVLIGAVEFRKC